MGRMILLKKKKIGMFCFISILFLFFPSPLLCAKMIYVCACRERGEDRKSKGPLHFVPSLSLSHTCFHSFRVSFCQYSTTIKTTKQEIEKNKPKKKKKKKKKKS